MKRNWLHRTNQIECEITSPNLSLKRPLEQNNTNVTSKAKTVIKKAFMPSPRLIANTSDEKENEDMDEAWVTN